MVEVEGLLVVDCGRIEPEKDTRGEVRPSVRERKKERKEQTSLGRKSRSQCCHARGNRSWRCSQGRTSQPVNGMRQKKNRSSIVDQKLEPSGADKKVNLKEDFLGQGSLDAMVFQVKETNGTAGVKNLSGNGCLTLGVVKILKEKDKKERVRKKFTFFFFFWKDRSILQSR